MELDPGFGRELRPAVTQRLLDGLGRIGLPRNERVEHTKVRLVARRQEFADAVNGSRHHWRAATGANSETRPEKPVPAPAHLVRVVVQPGRFAHDLLGCVRESNELTGVTCRHVVLSTTQWR